MAELTETVAGVAENVAEDALGVVANVAEGMGKEALNVANVSRALSGRDFGLGFLVGGSIGTAVTAFMVRRWLETKYTNWVEEEIDSMRRHYRTKTTEAIAFSPPVSEEKPNLERIVQERGYVPPPPGDLNVTQSSGFTSAKEEMMYRQGDVAPDELARFHYEEAEELITSVFDSTWDYEAELAARTPEKPYVIHRDEYKEGDFPGVTITYYEGDDVLCDDHNRLVENKDFLVGEENLSKFGHGSGSSHIVYVRNEKLSIDLEVIKKEGTFVEEVHGLRHSDDQPRRIRFYDRD